MDSYSLIVDATKKTFPPFSFSIMIAIVLRLRLVFQICHFPIEFTSANLFGVKHNIDQDRSWCKVSGNGGDELKAGSWEQPLKKGREG